MKPLSAEHREELRHVIRDFLAARPTAAPGLRAIRRGAASEVDYAVTEDDCAEALQVLIGLGLVMRQPDPLGSTPYFQITGPGVLAAERDETPHASPGDR